MNMNQQQLGKSLICLDYWLANARVFHYGVVGRGGGVGRILGVGSNLGVGVGLGVEVGVEVGVGVGVAVDGS